MENKEKIQRKIDFLADNLNKLDIMQKYSEEEFFGNFERIYAAEHLIQTTIQGLTDLAGFITGRGKFRSPKNSIDIIEILFENSLIPEEQKKLF